MSNISKNKKIIFAIVLLIFVIGVILWDLQNPTFCPIPFPCLCDGLGPCECSQPPCLASFIKGTLAFVYNSLGWPARF